MDQAMHVRGLTFRVHWILMSVDSPRRAEWEGGGPARSTAVIRYELSSGEDGRTTFKYTNEFHPPGGRLGSVAATYALEHLGGQAHAFTWAEFRARYESHFGTLPL